MAGEVVFPGCTPEPMASYLKALGAFRLIAEQADPHALGWWEQNAFRLQTSLNEESIVEFFLERYEPTPIVAPWNGGSGFYHGDRRTGLDGLLTSKSQRFFAYRDTIRAIQDWPEMPGAELSLGEMLQAVEAAAKEKRGKEERNLDSIAGDVRGALERLRDAGLSHPLLTLSISQLEAQKTGLEGQLPDPVKATQSLSDLLKASKKLRTAAKKLSRTSGKEAIIRACRNRLSDRVVDWLDAAVVLRTDVDVAYPPILGTGGSEGRLDYTNAFMERIVSLLLENGNGDSVGLLRNALFHEATAGLVVAAIGQHDPGRAGGYNQGPGIETKDFPTNPWNFVLAMEGSVAWASGVARRQGVAVAKQACSPFTVSARAVGYASSAESDEASSRAEIWMPLWDRPASFEELRALLREGRAEFGRKHARDGLQFAEAAVSLGTDRGISEFVRYQLLKRRGDSYVALPAGRFPVKERREADLLMELEPILARLDFFGRTAAKGGRSAPARFLLCRRAIDQAIFDFAASGGANRLQTIIVALGRIEQYFATQDHKKDPHLARPLAGLSPAWLVAADAGNLEYRVAAALSSINPADKVGSLRANLTSIDPQQPWSWADGRGQLAWEGNAFARRLSSALQRRMMDAERLGSKLNPLGARLELVPSDVCGFIAGSSSDALTEDLLFGLTLIDWSDNDKVRQVQSTLRDRWWQPLREHVIPRSWALLKHLFLPAAIRSGSGESVVVKPETSIMALLCAGRVADACNIAQRRLRSAGLNPTKVAFANGEDGVRLGAALLIPTRNISQLSRLVLNNDSKA